MDFKFQSPGGDSFSSDTVGSDGRYNRWDRFQSPGGDSFSSDLTQTRTSSEPEVNTFQSPGGDSFSSDLITDQR